MQSFYLENQAHVAAYKATTNAPRNSPLKAAGGPAASAITPVASCYWWLKGVGAPAAVADDPTTGTDS